MSPLPPATPLPEPPDPPERNDWRKRLHKELEDGPDKKHKRLERSYPPKSGATPAHWLHRAFPCIERQGVPFLEAVRKRKGKAQPKSERVFPAHETDGQGHGLPASDDIPF